MGSGDLFGEIINAYILLFRCEKIKKLYFGGSILTIDRDPLSVPENELRNIKVLSTIKEDQVLFHA